MIKRHELTQAEWDRIQPLLPDRTGLQGRPAKDARLLINGMLWIVATGAPWRDLPEHYGPWKTVYNTFQRWTKSGLWEQIYEALLKDAPPANTVEWTIWEIDSTTCKAHQHAAGGKGGRKPNVSDDPEVD